MGMGSRWQGKIDRGGGGGGGADKRLTGSAVAWTPHICAKTATRKYQYQTPEDSRSHIISQGKKRWGHKVYVGTNYGRNPQGRTRTLVQAKFGKGGIHTCRTRRKMHACGVGCRYKWRRLAVGGSGWSPVGELNTRVNEVGSRCYI